MERPALRKSILVMTALLGGGSLQSVLAAGLRMRKCVSVVCVLISVASSLFLDPPIS